MVANIAACIIIYLTVFYFYFIFVYFVEQSMLYTSPVLIPLSDFIVFFLCYIFINYGIIYIILYNNNNNINNIYMDT